MTFHKYLSYQSGTIPYADQRDTTAKSRPTRLFIRTAPELQITGFMITRTFCRPTTGTIKPTNIYIMISLLVDSIHELCTSTYHQVIQNHMP